MTKYPKAVGAGILSFSLFLTACGGSDDEAMPSSTTMAAMAQATSNADTGAATLRANLTSLLQEHVYLAGTATGEALAGRTANFQAASAQLDANSVDLSKAIGTVYGPSAESQFLALWRTHIGFFVDYTQGKAANDTAKVNKAKADLDQYGQDFGAFIAAANPNVTKQAIADNLKMHVTSLTAAIDAQAAKSTDAYAKLSDAAMHMPMTAAVLSGAIAKQYPDKFMGTADGTAATLRAGLTSLLQEHVYLAGTATGEALAGRTANFEAAAKVLDNNSVKLSQAIGSVYGPGAETQFLALWRTHIGFFVDYTQGKAANDMAKVDKARADLDKYGQDFGAFLAAANPNINKDAIADNLKMHVGTLTAAIDAQAAKSTDAYGKLREAAQHMPMTASVLSGAIAKQYPDKFGA